MTNWQEVRLGDVCIQITNGICFSAENRGMAKILAGYHQYFTVRKTIEATKHATKTDGKSGVF